MRRGGEGVRPAILHARDLAGCEHRLALDVSHPQLAADRPRTAEAVRRTEAANSHRDRVRDLLRAMHSDQPPGTFVIIGPERTSERVAATLRACADGASWIWNATLPTDVDGGRRGHSELLARVGDGYLPVIVVNHRVSYPAKVRRDLTPDATPFLTSPLWGWLPTHDPYRTGRNHRRDQMRLAHLTQMLLDLGLAPSGDESRLLGGSIGLDADCIVVHRTGTLLREYREVFTRRQAVASGDVLTAARRVSECRSCPWWPRCEPELVQRRDVSLVASGNQADLLVESGVTTIDQLARHRGPAPQSWPSNIAFDDAVSTAIAWLADIPLIRRVEEPQVRRADVEVDVDMESYGEDGAYMWGTLLTDRVESDRPVIYRAFVTWQPLPTRDEARSFAEFWTWLMAERAGAHAQGKTFAAYCYSQQAENRWLRSTVDRFADADGIPPRADVEDFIASDEWVDIYEAVGANFVCPQGKGLKRIAPVAGFTWRDAEAGGAASMDWYKRAVGLDGVDVDLSQRDRLLEYNEDDVRATKVLREWMVEPAARALPLRDDLLAFRQSGSDSRTTASDSHAHRA
ncbi:TM0106 family RecB-like putative nuclease [Gordonia sp. VNQ95]|uniref:TM0106 family RecB-like putative nuclease n=1 Tax=Gordonia sp. VNQ95 TaxID=3156619 RepID=UPI0032B61813